MNFPLIFNGAICRGWADLEREAYAVADQHQCDMERRYQSAVRADDALDVEEIDATLEHNRKKAMGAVAELLEQARQYFDRPVNGFSRPNY